MSHIKEGSAGDNGQAPVSFGEEGVDTSAQDDEESDRRRPHVRKAVAEGEENGAEKDYSD